MTDYSFPLEQIGQQLKDYPFIIMNKLIYNFIEVSIFLLTDSSTLIFT